MSSSSVNESSLSDIDRSSPPPELAPSQVAQDEPSFSRFVGMAGGAVAFAGGVSLLAQTFNGSRLLSPQLAGTLIVLGVLMMLYHAARDSDTDVRRTYGLFGLGLIGLFTVMTLIRDTNFVYMSLGYLGALSFLNFFLRYEDAEGWRKPTLLIIGISGVAMLGAIFVFGLFNPLKLTGYGILLGILSLAYLCTLAGHLGSSTSSARNVYVSMGLIGFALMGLAVIRSINSETYFVPAGLILIAIGVVYLIVAIGLISESQFVVVTRRELSTYFYSPIAYFMMLGMTLMGLLNFITFVNGIYMNPTGVDEPIVEGFMLEFVGLITPMILVPILTMRLLSEEKRTGTFDVLMSVPISELTVVLSKFFAAWLFFLLLWLPWGAYLLALQPELTKPFDYRPLFSFYVALMFTGAGFIAMGLFFSSLSKNQLIAAVFTFVMMLFFLAALIFSRSNTPSPFWKLIFSKLAYYRVWQQSLQGRLPLHDLIFHASLALFWLYLTVKSLESRKWK